MSADPRTGGRSSSPENWPTDPLLRIGVPDPASSARYRVTVLQVAGGDHELMDPADLEVLIAR